MICRVRSISELETRTVHPVPQITFRLERSRSVFHEAVPTGTPGTYSAGSLWWNGSGVGMCRSGLSSSISFQLTWSASGFGLLCM